MRKARCEAMGRKRVSAPAEPGLDGLSSSVQKALLGMCRGWGFPDSEGGRVAVLPGASDSAHVAIMWVASV